MENIKEEYPKLVRDNIPKLVKARTGKDIQKRILDTDEEYLKFLLKKIVEEARELESANQESMKEELADVLEVINSLLKLKGWDLEEIQKLQNEKFQKNGGFEKRILMLNKI